MTGAVAAGGSARAEGGHAMPVGLYVHLPWCVRKCPYCDFNSHQLKDDLPVAQYADALIADLEAEAALAGARCVSSVFFGGGTPSLFPGHQIARVLDAARSMLPFAADVEITLEANPGASDADRFASYAAAGVNRLSIGAQSFDPAALLVLGRIHGPEEIVSTVAMARAAGIRNLNIDLMFGLPGQDLAAAGEDVDAVLALAPDHVSYYQLTLEPGTHFASHPPELPPEETIWAIQQSGHRRLAAAGYDCYEVSAFARPGRRCRHNVNYWRFGDYIGIGAGAHGKLTDPGTGRVRRSDKIRSPRLYMAQAVAGRIARGERELQREDLVFEFMLNALRLTGGVDIALFERTTGLESSALESALEQAAARRLIEPVRGGRIVTTSLGNRFLNDLQAMFLP
jgi:oxygen-independent coproporphyrinogen-3 oxidase